MQIRNQNIEISNFSEKKFSKNNGYSIYGGFQSYPESLAKTCSRYKEHTDSEVSNDNEVFEKFIKQKAPKVEPDKIYKCTRGFLFGETTKNNYYKIITCGREWCSDCGKFHSIPHSRRINEVFPRFQALLQGGYLHGTGEKTEGSAIQYLVITVPFKLRELFKSKQVLNDFRTYWRRKLKAEGYEHGLTRYHWAGEDGYTWKPHLNILVPGAWLEKETLVKWRNELAKWYKSYFKLNYLPGSNIYTSFTYEENKLKHWVSYVLRPTQLIYNKDSEQTIKGFRNTAPFGKNWPSLIETEEQKREKERQGFEIDEETGEREKIIWRKKWSEIKKRFIPEVVPVQYVRVEDLKLIARGFWREEKYKPPPEPPDQKKLILEEDFCPF